MATFEYKKAPNGRISTPEGSVKFKDGLAEADGKLATVLRKNPEVAEIKESKPAKDDE